MEDNQPDHPVQSELMSADDYFERGNDYGLNNDYENAIADLTMAIRLSPTNAKYYFQRAVQHFIKSKWPDAIADYTEALRLKPDPSDDDEWNFTIDEAYHSRGIAYRYLDNYEAALADFAELIKLQPDYPHHYSDRSVIYKLKGDFENSFADLYTMQRLAPDDPVCLGLIADVQKRQSNLSAAMATYNEQAQLFGTPASYFDRGELWRKMGNLDNAIADFEEAIRVYPKDYHAYLTLGETYLANGNFAKAIETFDKVMVNNLIDPRIDYRYIALVLRARAHLASGNSEEAMRDFDEAIAVNTASLHKYPDSTRRYVYRGHAHAARGQIAEAVADYRKALELNPKHSEADTMNEYILKNS
jgi:tetratricopeptide (TPR) repeat protein